MHFETLYKTDKPDEIEHAEYYQPQLDIAFISGAWVYIVREKHGWWDPAEKKAVNHTTTFSPDEGFSESEARTWFENQQRHRALEGFVHAFYIDYFASENWVRHRKIELIRSPMP